MTSLIVLLFLPPNSCLFLPSFVPLRLLLRPFQGLSTFFISPLKDICGCQSVQSLSRVQLFATPWIATHQASLSVTNFQSLLKFMSIKSVVWSNNLILCCPRLLPPSIFSSIRIFSNKLVLYIRWPKYWNFSISINPSNEYSGLIHLGLTGLISLQSKGLLSLLQHHNSKEWILLCSAFSTAQLSQPYMTTGKAITLTRWTSAGKAMSLLFNMLLR